MKKEIRNTNYIVKFSGEGGEESRRIEGYALIFDTPSDGLYFEEVIERSALDGVLERSDVFALLDHSTYRGVLARWNMKEGSLRLYIDQKGLKYEFDAPNTSLGDELIENIKRGEIYSSSFAFSVEKDTWEKKSDGSYKRTINKIDKLYDVSPVYNAAYSKTSVYMRQEESDDVIDARTVLEHRMAIDKAEDERRQKEAEAEECRRKAEAEAVSGIEKIEELFNKL
jgi:HK97 family phage prohead protease